MKEWAQLIVSWPVVALIAIIFFRRPLRDLLSRFSTSDGGKAELGPIKLELGKLTEQGKDAVERTRAATELMAESQHSRQNKEPRCRTILRGCDH